MEIKSSPRSWGCDIYQKKLDLIFDWMFSLKEIVISKRALFVNPCSITLSRTEQMPHIPLRIGVLCNNSSTNSFEKNMVGLKGNVLIKMIILESKLQIRTESLLLPIDCDLTLTLQKSRPFCFNIWRLHLFTISSFCKALICLFFCSETTSRGDCYDGNAQIWLKQ